MIIITVIITMSVNMVLSVTTSMHLSPD